MTVLNVIQGVSYYNFINVLRHIAAIMVIFEHSYALSGGGKSNIYLDFGSLAVNIFFFLSGMLIYRSAMNSASIQQYCYKRFLRIYPALFCCIILTTLFFSFFSDLSVYSFFKNEITTSYIVNLFFIGEYSLPGVFYNNPYPNVVNGSLWTLRYEIVMYGISGIFVLNLFKNNKYSLLIVSVLLISFFYMCFFYLHKEVSLWANISRLGCYFFIGAAFTHFNFFNMRRYFFILIILLVILYVYTSNKDIYMFFLVSITLKVILDIIKKNEDTNKSTKINFDISYGLYIYAFPIQQLLIAYFDFKNILTYFISALILTIIVAIFSWFAIEKQALKVKYFV